MTPQTLARRFEQPTRANGHLRIDSKKSSSKRAVWAFGVLLGTTFAQGCGAPFVTESGSTSCLVGEVSYPLGEVIESDDCNECTCTEVGPLCTAMDCAVGCEYDGVHYQQNESFTTADGCSACTCLATGQVSCLALPCRPCKYQGGLYEFGDTFRCDFAGCGPMCECLAGGEIVCEQVGS